MTYKVFKKYMETKGFEVEPQDEMIVFTKRVVRYDGKKETYTFNVEVAVEFEKNIAALDSKVVIVWIAFDRVEYVVVRELKMMLEIAEEIEQDLCELGCDFDGGYAFAKVPHSGDTKKD